MLPIRPAWSAIALAILAGWAAEAAGQGLSGHAMGQAIPSLISAAPVPGGGTLTEGRVLQPVAMGDVDYQGVLRGRLTLNFERWTIEDGELAPGNWGEGFYDRRHPHTTVHEAIAWGVLQGDGVTGSLTAGKGFVPFGTDDPMSRPFLRYPVNHHYAQILERAVLAGGVKTLGVVLEGSVFNGDEPTEPSEWPNLERFGDSWALRATILPVAGVEVQGSHALVASPEQRDGFGLDQAKWSVSGRWDRKVGGIPVYALLEWARTTEADGAFTFTSVLGEGAVRFGRHLVGYRFERTTRPEEERQFDDPFRAVRPHSDDSILGVTRWTLHTMHYEVRFEPAGSLGISPFAELTLGTVQDEGPGLFSAETFYGGDTSVTSLVLGFRMDLGGAMPRMGRYGVVAEPMDHKGSTMQSHTH